MGVLDIGLLVLAGIVAGWVNTVAGGGSMLSVPALMWYGLAADVANGTSRVAILAQGVAAVAAFRREKKLELPLLWGVAVPSVLGAVLGAYVATIVPNSVFEPILIATLFLMAASMFLKPSTFAPPAGAVPIEVRRNAGAWLALFGVGFYGGFLQAGVGILLLAVFAGLCRIDLVRGNALKVAVVFAYTIVVVLVFAARAKVDWPSGAVLAVGNVIGAELGVRFAVRQGQTAMRNVLFVVILLAIASLLLK
jgi:uncharacterized membrane protein YfcA